MAFPSCFGRNQKLQLTVLSAMWQRRFIRHENALPQFAERIPAMPRLCSAASRLFLATSRHLTDRP
jgi:hypothetical protein